MTVLELKKGYERHNPGGQFFSERVLRLFGNSINDFIVKTSVITAMTDQGVESLEVYDLIGKQSADSGLYGHCAYFRKDNFKIVMYHA